MTWYVYIILCSDNSLYTGITTDPERRFRQHSDGNGARYFRGRRPLGIVYLEAGHSRSSAGSRELQIKRMTHGAKSAMITATVADTACRSCQRSATTATTRETNR
ncbi:MAG: GIY-YIG nuclease family protein [Deltaproteobacteria bacterium]|nr:GIY-YIG nuclease family protein [Deltaproteobacteria bacterium]